MSPTDSDTPQQGGSLDSSQPDPTPFNPKEIAVDKNVPWQKSEPPPFDEKDGLFKHNNQFGHEQNAGGGHELVHTVQQGDTTPPDRDGLNDPWEDKKQIDINTDGHLDSKGQGGGGEEVHADDHGRVKVQFQWDREGKKDSHEGGQNEFTHKRPTRPAPIILAIIAILILLLGVGLITILGGRLTSSNANNSTATTSSGGEIPTDAPTEAATRDTNQSSSTGGAGDQPTAVVTEPPPPVVVVTEPPAECTAGWLPAAGCFCCGTTLTCADGTLATFNPACGVGGGSTCTCVPTDPFCTNPATCPFQCQENGSSCMP